MNEYIQKKVSKSTEMNLLCLHTHHSVLLHPGLHLLHLPRHHPREDGRVGPLTEQQVVSWAKTKPPVRLIQWHWVDVTVRVARSPITPALDLTMTLILLRTESKFSTWSSSNLRERQSWLSTLIEDWVLEYLHVLEVSLMASACCCLFFNTNLFLALQQGIAIFAVVQISLSSASLWQKCTTLPDLDLTRVILFVASSVLAPPLCPHASLNSSLLTGCCWEWWTERPLPRRLPTDRSFSSVARQKNTSSDIISISDPTSIPQTFS